MDVTRLTSAIPKLKTPLQLTGFLVVVAAVIMRNNVAAANVQVQISLGAIGVLLVIFGQLFHFIGTAIPKHQRARLLVTMFVLFCVFIIGLIAATSYFFIKANPSAIVLMDSSARIYGEGVGGPKLNSAILSVLLADVAATDTEATYPGWVADRCEQVRRKDPALVVLHQSAFCKETEANANCHDAERELFDFFRCMSDTQTKFLIYTRYAHGPAVLAAAEQNVPKMKGRLLPFPLTRPTPSGAFTTYDFDDDAIRRELKQQVRAILASSGDPRASTRLLGGSRDK